MAKRETVHNDDQRNVSSTEKTCFVIMPISDHAEYAKGHFNRVYEYLIKPAVIEAGFIPKRADDTKRTNMIALEIVKDVIESDMAICDLSSRNPNVLYEAGLRQAFNKPLTFIKDLTTPRIFDIQNFRDVEYDASLRIDLINNTIPSIAEAIIDTYENDGKDINSLVALLGIKPAEVKSTEVSSDTQILLNAIESVGQRLADVETRSRNSINLIDAVSLPEKGENLVTLTGNDFLKLQKGSLLYYNQKPRYIFEVVRRVGGRYVLEIKERSTGQLHRLKFTNTEKPTNFKIAKI